ncbi:CDP-alcohol phosphatidyltransferase family protein [Streptomyces diastaticus]|uniref:CDP-alcohol phosphatidyltransferase family protein n=1 Tax=Streptomyces diastaticus TaxID=1956 RepID=UPI0036609682
MYGLYALKPWYAARLAGVRGALARRRVSPDALTAAGIGAASAAGAALALLPAGWAGAPVAMLLAARLACANLDGALARDTGRSTRRGALLNETGDRAADLVVVAAFWPLAPGWLVALAACAATLPSWVSLAGAATGAVRLNGGPVGKTERCLLAVVAAATGWYAPVLAVLAVGSAATAVLRGARLWRELGAADRDGRASGEGLRARPAPAPALSPAAPRPPGAPATSTSTTTTTGRTR